MLRHTATATLVCALTAPTAWAQAPAECEAKDPTTAEINAREGVRLAKAGKFAESVPLFRMAVRLDTCDPGHLLLLARGLARSKQTTEARRRYNEVLATFPKSAAAKRAKKELAKLPREAPKPAPTPSGSSLEPAPAPGPDWLTMGLMTAGAGALVTVGGVFFALDAQSADDDLQTAARQPDRARYQELVDQRDRSTTLSYVFYGLGGAAIVTGATMALLPLFDDAPAKSGEVGPKTAFVPLDGGGMVTFGAQF